MNRPTRILLATVCAIGSASGAAGQVYDVRSIPPALVEEGDAVVRRSTTRFTVEGPGRAVEQRHRVVTILNEDGRDYATVAVAYDRFRKLKSIEARLLDARGRVVRRIKKGDFEDLPATASTSLYDDNRVRMAELAHHTYPYTVAFEYELVHDGLLDWPDWAPLYPEVGLERATFELRVPEGMEVRYKAWHLDVQPEVLPAKTGTLYRWSIHHQPPWQAEPWGPPWSQQAPRLMIAPSAFEIEGHTGTMRSWEAFGRWYAVLNAGRDALPPDEQARIRALVEGASSERERVRLLYDELQRRTRYVSVQLGIGGWQTFDAGYVVERGYGDCKALANYMQAMLRTVGIAAFPVLVYAGAGAVDLPVDFPHNAFNHVILAVPIAEADTVWLETTSQTMPFGHLGSFTENRYALLATLEGSRLVRIPASTAADNRQIRHATIDLSRTGDAAITLRTRYTGNQQDGVRRALVHASARDREMWLRNQIGLPSFQLKEADLSGVDGDGLALEIPATVEVPRLVSRAGRRFFLQPNLLEKWTTVPPEMDEPRTQPVHVFTYPFADSDSLVFRVPEGYAVEAGMEPVEVETDFARYEASLTAFGDGRLVYVRRVTFTQTRLPAERYEDVRAFIRRVVEADRAQIVLVART